MSLYLEIQEEPNLKNFVNKKKERKIKREREKKDKGNSHEANVFGNLSLILV